MIGYYVFRQEPGPLASLRAALEQARDEIRQRPNEGEDPLTGLQATAERVFRMTDPAHWRRVKGKLEDGSEVEGYQYQPPIEEMELRKAAVSRSSTSMQGLMIRNEVQTALLDSSKSSSKIVKDGIAWARTQPIETQTGVDAEERDFDKEWNWRAKIMAAALAARDYDGADRAEVLSWARPLLNAAVTEGAREYSGPQIEYNTPAIAGLGLAALYLRDGDASARTSLLRLARNQHPAVMSAFGREIISFSRVDARQPRSLLRIRMTAAIHPRRVMNKRQDEVNRTVYEERVETAITAEIDWLDGKQAEPAWPQLPAWPSRPRRGIRLADDWPQDREEDALQVRRTPKLTKMRLANSLQASYLLL